MIKIRKWDNIDIVNSGIEFTFLKVVVIDYRFSNGNLKFFFKIKICANDYKFSMTILNKALR